MVHRSLLFSPALGLASLSRSDAVAGDQLYRRREPAALGCARTQGFLFAREKLAVKVSPTPNSVELSQSLIKHERGSRDGGRSDQRGSLSGSPGEVKAVHRHDISRSWGFSRENRCGSESRREDYGRPCAARRLRSDAMRPATHWLCRSCAVGVLEERAIMPGTGRLRQRAPQALMGEQVSRETI